MSQRRFSIRAWITVLTVVALAFALIAFKVAPQADAAEVQPTNVTFSLTNPDGNEPAQLKSYEPYKFTFGFAVPDGTRPGDTLRIALPSQFDVVEHTVGSLGEGTTAATEKTADGTVVTVTFGEGISGLINLQGEFSFITNYVHTDEGESDVDVTVTLGNEKVYTQVLKGMGPPPAPPMAINKWSGYSTANTNIETAKALKLQTPKYNYQWIKPAGDQVFAHWFVELNNWQGENSPEEIGQNIVITDTLSGLPDDFVPVVEPSEPGALTQAQINEQFEGNFLANFFSVAVRDAGETTTYPELNSLGQTRPYIDFAGNKFTFRVSDYLKSIGVTPSNSAQYAVNYYTLVPAVSANVTNVASVDTDRLETEASDVGWYRSVNPDGWIYGEQPLTSLRVTKAWEGWDESNDGAKKPEVTFTLLADGRPARDIDNVDISERKLPSGESEIIWTNLPTQSAKGVPIVYSVKEKELEGFKSDVKGTYTPDLTNLDNIQPGLISVVNTKESITPPEAVGSTPPGSPGSSTSGISWWLIVPFIGVPLIASSSSSGSSEPTPVVERAEPVVSEENTSTPHTPAPTQEPGKPGQAKQRHLANTGANTMALTLIALVLLIVGGALLIRRRAYQID